MNKMGNGGSKSPTKSATGTPIKADRAIPIVLTEDDLESATQMKTEKEGGLRYDVVLSPAVKKGPAKVSPASSPTSPTTKADIFKKLKDAEERRQSLESVKVQQISAKLAKIELAQQKKEEIVTEKSNKALEKLESKLTAAEKNRASQLNEVKEKLGEHMEKIEKAQKELEMQIEAAKVAAEASLNEKMESHKKKRDEEMEEMLKKIQEHKDKITEVRCNQEERLKPYVQELENNIKVKLEKAKLAKEKQEEQLKEKLAEYNKRGEIVRKNKEKLVAEGGGDQTTESA